MAHIILALAAALAIITAGGTATKQTSNHPVIVTPADTSLPGPV